jgi:hypothetical protein
LSSIFENFRIMKVRDMLRNCVRWKETKAKWQLDATCDYAWDAFAPTF